MPNVFLKKYKVVLFKIPLSNGHNRRTTRLNAYKLRNSLNKFMEIYFPPIKKKRVGRVKNLSSGDNDVVFNIVK